MELIVRPVSKKTIQPTTSLLWGVASPSATVFLYNTVAACSPIQLWDYTYTFYLYNVFFSPSGGTEHGIIWYIACNIQRDMDKNENSQNSNSSTTMPSPRHVAGDPDTSIINTQVIPCTLQSLCLSHPLWKQQMLCACVCVWGNKKKKRIPKIYKCCKESWNKTK